MTLVSDNLLYDEPLDTPKNPVVYPVFNEFEFWNPNAWTKGQPHALFDKMRSEAPVMWTEARKGLAGFWSVTRYEDLKSVELQPGIFSSERGSINMMMPKNRPRKHERLGNAAVNSLINLDAPRHMKLRIQHKDFFVPQYVSEVSDRVSAKVDELLDDAERKGPVLDFVKAFSEKLPLFTLCEMLGIDEEDRPKIIRWMHFLEMAQQFVSSPARTFLAEPTFPFLFDRNVQEMFEYGKRVLEERRKNPRHDLLSAIATAELDGEKLSQEWLDGSWLLIIFAGNDTSRNSISGTLRLLTEFPDQRQMVLDDPSLVPAMMQEALRMVSPVTTMRRTALADAELNGQRIAKDEKVVLWYGAANRDPDVFPDPHKMDITRENVAKHMAFGHGPHKCLGSRIAQMQLQISLGKILERFPNIHWTGKQKIAPNSLVHAISRLEVNLYGPNGSRPTMSQVPGQK